MTFSACKHKVSGSISLPSRGAFHRSFTVLFSIGHRVVFRLGGWSPRIPTGFHVSGGTLETDSRVDFSPTGFSPSPIDLPMPFGWPLPRSLATTYGISVDFSSSPYLDVSVQAVPLIRLCIQRMMTRLSSCRIAPFGNPRI